MFQHKPPQGGGGTLPPGIPELLEKEKAKPCAEATALKSCQVVLQLFFATALLFFLLEGTGTL